MNSPNPGALAGAGPGYSRDSATVYFGHLAAAFQPSRLGESAAGQHWQAISRSIVKRRDWRSGSVMQAKIPALR